MTEQNNKFICSFTKAEISVNTDMKNKFKKVN